MLIGYPQASSVSPLRAVSDTEFDVEPVQQLRGGRSFKAAGLDDVSVEVVPIAVDDLGVFTEAFVLARVLDAAEDAGVLTDDEVLHFRAALEQAAEIGGFFASVQQLLVTGRKPDVTASA